jgi:hypothetical protein
LSHAAQQKILDQILPVVSHLNSIISYQKQDIDSLNKELDFHRQLYEKYTGAISQLVSEVKQERTTIKNEIQTVHDTLQILHNGIENLEWNEDVVSEFLAKVEETIKQSTLLLKSLISNHEHV